MQTSFPGLVRAKLEEEDEHAQKQHLRVPGKSENTPGKFFSPTSYSDG